MKNTTTRIVYAIFGVLAFAFVYLLVRVYGLPTTTEISPESVSIWAVFLTGLLTGGLTCLAVQGGLLASSIAQHEEEKLKEKIKDKGNAKPIVTFLVAKLIAYTILGLLLGWFGSLFQLSITAQIVMQFAVAIFMLGTALQILNVHPIFRYFLIQPPRFIFKFIKNQSKSKSLFAPALLGAFTVFIPCGTTQAMMALAIASGNPFLGATIMFAFVLGTSPVFFILGYFASRLGEKMHDRFMKGAAIALILLSLFTLKGAFALLGVGAVEAQKQSNLSAETTDSQTIEFTATSYQPRSITVKAGSHVTLNLVNKNGSGCIQAFTIPKLGIQKIVRVGQTDKVEFDAPSEKGKIAFMCSMGMYQGVINVI